MCSLLDVVELKTSKGRCQIERERKDRTEGKDQWQVNQTRPSCIHLLLNQKTQVHLGGSASYMFAFSSGRDPGIKPHVGLPTQWGICLFFSLCPFLH